MIRLAIFAIVVPIAVVVWIVIVPVFDVVSSAVGSLMASATSRRKRADTRFPDIALEASELTSRRGTTEDVAAPAAPGPARQAS
jgi:hypothetical protein